MNTQKTLLAILVEELPKRGGWPEGVAAMAQDADGAVQNYIDTNHIIIDDEYARGTSKISFSYSIGAYEIAAASDRLTAIITRDQYEAALIDRPEYFADAEGWTPWCGGECPVDRELPVDLKFRDGDSEEEGHQAGAYRWNHKGGCSDIIAYRLHQPQDANSRANDERLLNDLAEREVGTRETIAQAEANLNECIGQPQPSKDELISDLLMDMAANDANMPLREAYELADALISVGYRKQ